MNLYIQELNHVALHVHDLAASMQFYGNKLGLASIARPNFDFNGAWFALGSQQLHLIEGHVGKADSFNRGNHFAVRVENIESTRQYLNKQGITYIGPKLRPDGATQIFIIDPDGYNIEFCEIA
jgi:catechol 2,3-dioxygenase-like lactoylglutathione lyase family enzyme